MNTEVKQAILNTPTDYLQKILDQRNPGPNCVGSQFLREQDVHSLMEANWEPAYHEAIAEPAKGFKAVIPGYMGVVKVSDCGDYPLMLQPSNKGTGFMEVVVHIPKDKHLGELQDYTWALVGPGDEGNDVLWTVFPGNPIPPSTTTVDGTAARPITKKEAQEAGFEYAKVVRI